MARGYKEPASKEEEEKYFEAQKAALKEPCRRDKQALLNLSSSEKISSAATSKQEWDILQSFYHDIEKNANSPPTSTRQISVVKYD